MTTQIGTVTGVSLKKNKNGDNVTVMLQVELSEVDDVQSVELYTQSGFETIPALQSSVFVLQVTESYKIGIAVNDGIEPTIEKGEVLLYSQDGGVKKAQLFLRKDGHLSLGNGTDDIFDLFDQLLTKLQGNVDNPGVASTGTNSLILADLATIQASLANIKI